MSSIDLSKLQTEASNPRSERIDEMSALEVCELVNREDASVSAAVSKCLPAIAAAVEEITERVGRGGRVIYMGAGTSGRLGILDASEIPPTFSAPSDQFIGLIAGGDAAIRTAQEGVEDDTGAALRDLEPLSLDGTRDALIGIAASGRTPYVLAALSHAKKLGCATIGISCSKPSEMGTSGVVDFLIEPVTGAEVVSGSTRMKAGTATKMVLNILSTACMIRSGKTWGNTMVDLTPTNLKLKERSRGIIRRLCGPLAPPTDKDIDILLRQCEGSVKLAIAVCKLKCSVDEARNRLNAAGGRLALALKTASSSGRTKGQPNGSSPKLVLCVDGGGSKCRAVVRSSMGDYAEGTAGPCNVSTLTQKEAVASIVSAVESALSRLPAGTFGNNSSLLSLRTANFAAVWLGLAGYGRVASQSALDSALAQLFAVSPSRIRVTGDTELNLAALGAHPSLRHAAVLIAGTGAIASTYRLTGSSFTHLNRSGGWGALLGDDGGAFEIGRKAVKFTLEKVERGEDIGVLGNEIMTYFGISQKSAKKTLLEVILAGGAAESSSQRARIAAVAKLVLQSAPQDKDAFLLVQDAAKISANLVGNLVTSSGRQPGYNSAQLIDPTNSALLFGGGMMRDDAFRQMVRAMLTEKGITFARMEAIPDPATVAVDYLVTRFSGEKAVASKL